VFDAHTVVWLMRTYVCTLRTCSGILRRRSAGGRFSRATLRVWAQLQQGKAPPLTRDSAECYNRSSARADPAATRFRPRTTTSAITSTRARLLFRAPRCALRARLIAAYTLHIGLPVRRHSRCRLRHRARLRRTLLRVLAPFDITWALRRAGVPVSALRLGARLPGKRTVRRRPSLVVCYDVLQYLDDRHSSTAIANLARLCRGALYLHGIDAAGLVTQL